MKIVINKCYGGFGLSRKAQDMYCEVKGINPGKWQDVWKFYEDFHENGLDRSDPVLVDIVERLGEEANGSCADLKIVEIPDGVQWGVHEYDGVEWIAEVHRTWS